MTRKLALAAILLTMAVAVLPASAAAAPVTVGLGDQSWNIFSDHYFQALGLKRVRVVTPWNVALSRGDRAWLDEYLAGVQLAGIEPLVSFGAANPYALPRPPVQAADNGAVRSRVSRLSGALAMDPHNQRLERGEPPQPADLPLSRAGGALLQHRQEALPRVPDRGGRRDRRPEHGPLDRPLPHRGPRAAAVGAPQLPRQQPAAAASGTAERSCSSRTVPGKIWLTETGGIVKFVLPDGHTLFPYSERRANIALGRLLRLARAYRSEDRAAVRVPLAPGPRTG